MEDDKKIVIKVIRFLSALAAFLISSSVIFLVLLLAVGFFLGFKEESGLLGALLVIGILICTLGTGGVVARLQYKYMNNSHAAWHFLIIIIACIMYFSGFTPAPFTYAPG